MRVRFLEPDLGCRRAVRAGQPWRWSLGGLEDAQSCDVALAALRRQGGWLKAVELLEGLGWQRLATAGRDEAHGTRGPRSHVL